MFDSLNKMKEEFSKLKEDLNKVQSEKKDGTDATSIKVNPLMDEDIAKVKSSSKKLAAGCGGCLGLVAVIVLILVLVLGVACLKSCANTDNVGQIKGQSLTDDISRAAIATLAGDNAAYSDLQTKKDVERILNSKGFCVTSHEGVLSNEGWERCLYFGFVSQVSVSYDKSKRVRNVDYQNIIPGSQLLSLAIQWFFQ